MTVVFDSININELKLGPVKASKASAACKTAYIVDRNGSRLSIQTPVMPIPWDITPRQMDPNNNFSCNMSVSFSNESEDPDVAKFKQFLSDLDSKVKTLAAEQSASLGKKAEKKVIDSHFKDSVKQSSNGDYPPTFQPKVWLKCKDEGSMKCLDDISMDLKVFNMNQEDISPSLLKKGCPAALIVSPSYIWASSLGVGITWVANQVITQPIEEKKCGFDMQMSAFDKFKRKRDDTEDNEVAKKASVEKEEDEESYSTRSSNEDEIENEEEQF